MCQLQELNENVIAIESRLGEALTTEAKALRSIEQIREDRSERIWNELMA